MTPALLSLSLLLAAGGDPTLPVCPRDWKVEVVAEAPRVVHPSVVACAPDGRVFVAEDPMDISAPSADLPLGRIVCLHPDGRLTVFAEGLHAVFGMQYLEGRLYVLHNPRFSVFTDEQGVGRERFDLIESTNPRPWALDWNDHVPAGFKLAMDGYFYVAVGDKGIYGAVGRDGKRVDLFAGGVLRLRPDATALEVHSTGVRNILDVAIDAEDELFTYDNTDERNWWSRLAHMVDGGSYGYPYDFLPPAPHTLPPMADYGGGAATGALVYNEDALPAEYQGNLFLADFGRRQVMRLRVERAGATFKVVSREEDLLTGPPQFRPVGIALAPDGLGLYVCDWRHPDTKDKVKVGRLLRVSYTGASRAAPRPGWFLEAALGKRCGATLEQLLGGLRHPALSVRLTAQRRIAERGKEATAPLMRLLLDRSAPVAARRHAIWALDAIDGGASDREAILALFADPDRSLRLQAARQLGTRRVRAAVPGLLALLRDREPSVRFHAATGLGRIGDPAAVPALLVALEEPDLFARQAVATALQRIGRAERGAWKTIAAGLSSPEPLVREGTLLAFRESYEPEVAASLLDFLRGEHPAEARAAALATLADLHRRLPPWKGEWWGYHPVDQPRPAKTVEWAATRELQEALRRALLDREAPVRRAAVEGLSRAREKSAAPDLRELFSKERDPEVRRAVLRALAGFEDPGVRELARSVLERPEAEGGILLEALEAAGAASGTELAPVLGRLLERPGLDRAVRLKTLETLGKLRAPEAVAVLARTLGDADGALRRSAIEGLAAAGAKEAAPAIIPLLRDPDPEARRAAARALGRLGERKAIPELAAAFQDQEARFEAAAALARMADPRGLDGYLFGLSSPSSSLREESRKALRAIAKEALPLLEPRWDALVKSPRVAAEIQRIYREIPFARESRILKVEVRGPVPSDYLDFALKHAGDPARGKKIFFDSQGVACVRCHSVRGRREVAAGDPAAAGGDLGPDLSHIGAQEDRRGLAESVLDPSRVIRDAYRQEIVVTRSGDLLSGILKGESPEEITLQDAGGARHRIPRSSVRERTASELSLMPEGLQEGLTLEEFADLIGFLASLR
jgi:putative membrane-bound dehydrogenase-like protein